MEIICGKKYNDLSHVDWVNYQLKCNLNNSLRNVLLHTSFIEAILIDKSEDIKGFPFTDKEKCNVCNNRYRTIRGALKVLEKEKVISNNEKMDCFDKLFDTRNRLIHSVARKGKELDQNQIEKLRNDMYEKIMQIYRSSPVILGIFRERGYSLPSEERFYELSSHRGDT